MAKILLLGGTGAIGTYLAPELIRLGHEVHVTTRSTTLITGNGCHYINGDARDKNFLARITREQTYDAIIDFMIYGTEEFRHRCDMLLVSTGHYLFLSSYRVFADTGKMLITERSPRLIDVCKDREYLNTDEYALTKARQEDILRDSCMHNWTILRPCITYSKNRFQLGTLEANMVCYRALQGLPILMAREILAKITTMTWAGDASKLIARLTLKEQALSDDFNVATSEHLLWSEVAHIYREAIGLKIKETDLVTYEKIVGCKYQIRYDRMLDRRLDNQKVLLTTGISQSDFVPLRSGLKMELDNYRRDPNLPYLDLGLHARMDSATHSRISMSALSNEQIAEYNSHKNPRSKRLTILKQQLLGRFLRLLKCRPW
jgi:nucleoside-diphosphate-sugar epimerase